jgi:ABC-type transport system involved in cytochrome c biogenesis permease subunit
MNSIVGLSSLGFFALFAAAAVQVFFLFKKERKSDPISRWILLAVFAVLSFVILERSLEIQFFALTGTFESLVFYGAFVCLLGFVYPLQKKIPFSPVIQFGMTMAAIALLAIASSPLAPKNLLAPIPALRSSWLLLHVSFAFIGEAFFVVSFIASIAFLVSKDELARKNYDRITYTAIAVGYPIFTAGAMIFGAVWAERAWGRWWGWDPKETWALVTWLVYTFYLHLRLVTKRSDRLPAVVSVVGFLCTLFTFFGVNFLLAGLHSYG